MFLTQLSQTYWRYWFKNSINKEGTQPCAWQRRVFQSGWGKGATKRGTFWKKTCAIGKQNALSRFELGAHFLVQGKGDAYPTFKGHLLEMKRSTFQSKNRNYQRWTWGTTRTWSGVCNLLSTPIITEFIAKYRKCFNIFVSKINDFTYVHPSHLAIAFGYLCYTH